MVDREQILRAFGITEEEMRAFDNLPFEVAALQAREEEMYFRDVVLPARIQQVTEELNRCIDSK